jgi:hypothetical protein
LHSSYVKAKLEEINNCERENKREKYKQCIQLEYHPNYIINILLGVNMTFKIITPNPNLSDKHLDLK